MVLEVQFQMSCLYPPVISNLPICDSVLLEIASSDVKHLTHNQRFGQAQSSKRESMTEPIWRLAVDLTRNDTRGVAHRLLESNSGCAPVMRSNVDVEPGEIDSRAIVYSDSAKESSEVFHAVGRHSE